MGETKSFSQNKFGVKLTFDFDDDRMNYTLRDYSGELRFPVPYEAINVHAPSTLVVNNAQYVQKLLAIPAVGIIVAAAYSGQNGAVAEDFGYFFAAMAVLLLLARRVHLFAFKYTLLQVSPSPAGAGNRPIRVIDDKNHATILEEINARWKARIRKLHGAVNFANDADKEIARFSWLKQQAVISDEEYREAVEKLRAYASLRQPQSAQVSLN